MIKNLNNIKYPANENLNKMLEINLSQKNYYEFDLTDDFKHGGNIATKLWDFIRETQYKITDTFNFNAKMFEIHKEWLGDLSDKKVLDLGCHTGNELSLYLGQQSKEYIGVDLSSSALEVLKNKFQDNGVTNAKFISADFLSNEFQEKDFDIIYAKAVFHHFKYFEDFLIVLKSKLKPNGRIITLDPMNTFLPIKIVRALYRNFQKDKDWEYPFEQETFGIIEKYYNISKIAGMMGKTKWVFPIYFISKKLSVKLSNNWINEDLYKINLKNSALWKCLRVSLLLENK